MRNWFIGLVALPVLLLTACGGGNAHKGEHCVRSHQETYVQMICSGYNAQGICTVYVPVTETNTVCDKYAPDDPSTVSKHA